MADMREGVGITAAELRPGTAVMVPVGAIPAMVNGGPCIIAYAIVRGPADGAAMAKVADGQARYWLDVYLAPGHEPMPQMYAAREILGIPAYGLRMAGAPASSAPAPAPGDEGPAGAQQPG